MPTDVQKLIGQIAAQNHVVLDDDDPIFAVYTINRLMLGEVTEELVQRIRTSIAAFEASARAVDAQSGKMLAEEMRRSASAWKTEIARDMNIANARSRELIDKIHLAHTRPEMLRWTALGLLAGLLFFGCGTLFGLYIR